MLSYTAVTGTDVPTVLSRLGQSGLKFSPTQPLAIDSSKNPIPPAPFVDQHYSPRNSENNIARKKVRTGMAYFCPRVSVRLGGLVVVRIETVVVKFVVADCR